MLKVRVLAWDRRLMTRVRDMRQTTKLRFADESLFYCSSGYASVPVVFSVFTFLLFLE